MKSRLTPLASSTTAKGPKDPGSGRPRTSLTKRASACLSWVQTMVWFSSTAMSPRIEREARFRSRAGVAVHRSAAGRNVVAGGLGAPGAAHGPVGLGEQVAQHVAGDAPERAP